MTVQISTSFRLYCSGYRSNVYLLYKNIHTVPIIYRVLSTLSIHSREPLVLESHGTFFSSLGTGDNSGPCWTGWFCFVFPLSHILSWLQFWCCHFCFQTEFGTLWFRLALTLYDPPVLVSQVLGHTVPPCLTSMELGTATYLSVHSKIICCVSSICWTILWHQVYL